MWACGAAGSALPWHGRGHRFDPDQVHQSNQQLSESARRPGFAPPLGWRGSLGARCCTDTALRAPPQNWRRSANWISRGVPAPTGLTGVVVFTLLVMLPKPLTKMVATQRARNCCFTESRTHRTAEARLPMCLECSIQTCCIRESPFTVTGLMRLRKAED